MAKINYLVDGLSGVGKSTVCEELIRRGHHAIGSDGLWTYFADPETGLPGGPHRHETFMWDSAVVLPVLRSEEPDVLFVCGGARNRDQFRSYFRKVFNLRIDDDTMRRRLTERTNNNFGKKPGELELMLRLNRADDRPADSIDIDAVRPLAEVVDDILARCRC